MDPKDEFYIGYATEKNGPSTRKRIRLFLGTVLGALLLTALFFSLNQRPSRASRFDFDTPTQLSGTYYEAPYPMLRMKVAEGEFKDLVLLGFGKFGARPFVEPFGRSAGVDRLHGKPIQLSGNLIYYQGKTLVQINDSGDLNLGSGPGHQLPLASRDSVQELQGEIVDPNCFFGVMKPGFGKVHRSCASLCIAGGIPPVLRVLRESGEEDFYLITTDTGEEASAFLWKHVGKPLRASGIVSSRGSWNYFALDTTSIRFLDQTSIYDQ